MTSAAATLSASPAKIGRVLSPGGVEAWHVQSDLVPLVALAFTFEGGSAKDPPGKAGVAQMLARLLDEGAGAYSSDAFQERLAARAIELSFNAGPDAVGGSLKTLVRHADEAFALLRLASPRRASTRTRSSACAPRPSPGCATSRTIPASWPRGASSPRRFRATPTAIRRAAPSRASPRSPGRTSATCTRE